MTKNHKKFNELAEKNHSMLVSQLAKTNMTIRKLLLNDLTEQQQETLISEMEYIQIILKDYRTNKLCPKCDSNLYLSDLEDYDHTCYECDESFYKFEVCS
jgi:NADH pyrophosphatase NudC (nudix superfamily)